MPMSQSDTSRAYCPNDPTFGSILKSLPATSAALGLETRVINVRGPSDLDSAFATAKRENLQALLIGTGLFFVSHRAEVTALAAKAKLPALYGIREFVLAGGLMSYGTDLANLYREMARLVDKIFKGASAADLPIARPNKFELLINLKAAKALGLTFSPSLVRA
jgi:putative ABC transport system substrate-binding protein